MKTIKILRLNMVICLFYIGVVTVSGGNTDQFNKTGIFFESFDSNTRSWITDNNWLTGKLDSGYYHVFCKNYNNTNGISAIEIPFKADKDWELEASVRVLKGSGALIFGMNDKFDHYRLEITKENVLYLIRNEVSKSSIDEIAKVVLPDVAKSDFTILTLRKVNGKFQLLVNSKLVKETKAYPLFGNKIGFSVSKRSEIIADNLSLSYITPKIVIEAATNTHASKTNLPKAFPDLVVSNIKFLDENNNNTIDASENCMIMMTIRNKGKGKADALKARIFLVNDIVGLDRNDSILIGKIEAGDSISLKFQIHGKDLLATALASYHITFDEKMGFPPDPVDLQIATRKFETPLVKVVDYTFYTDNGKIKPGLPVQLKVMVQNIGTGDASDVTVDFSLPGANIFPTGESKFNLGFLKAGQSQELTFEFMANKLYSAANIPIDINVNEKKGKYSENKNVAAVLNSASGPARTVVISNPLLAQSSQSIQIATLTADVDKNIPSTGVQNTHRYALIIGNEDYSSFQPGLGTEVNVDYAANDAQIFREYAIYTLGIPEKQVKLLTNATEGQMNQGIAWLSNLAKVENGKAELFVYYSGHGLPDEDSHEAYLIPVDVTGNNVKQGIQLKQMLRVIAENPSERISVFVDACFSGGARNKGLIAMKGVKVKPKETALNGNIIFFSSSSGDESSGVYREKKHGFFTYYLLKKLQETQGNISYKELAEYVTLNVAKETSLISKPQTPELRYNAQLGNQWENWKIK